MPTVWFITGASRGIGLEFVNQLTQDDTNLVIATCRSPETAEELLKLKSSESQGHNLHIVALDVDKEASIRDSEARVKSILNGEGIDYILNNAAVSAGNDVAFNMSYDAFLDTFRANVAGPALIAQVYLPYLEKGSRKVILNMTSGLASFGLDLGAKNASYTISKTALNMLTYKQSKERPGIISVCVDPGWVKTKMGGEGAILEVHESVGPFVAFLKRVGTPQSGGFFDRHGNAIAW